MLEDSPTTTSEEEVDRLVWVALLEAVMGGDVLRSEKTRVAMAMESANDEQKSSHNIWLGIRAKFHSQTIEKERQSLEEHRLRTVMPVVNEINNFIVTPFTADDDYVAAFKQTTTILHRLEVVQALYPSLKAMTIDVPPASEPQFQARVDALNTWTTLFITIRDHIARLQKWTGSETLDVTQPNTSGDIILKNNPSSSSDGPTKVPDGSSFVERLLKEETMQQAFEQAALFTVYSLVVNVKDAQVKFAPLFKQMGLPRFEDILIPIVSYPTKLAQAALRIRLDYVNKLLGSADLIIDEMMEDLKLSIGLACTLKSQYQTCCERHPDGLWDMPQCIPKNYDDTVLEGIDTFFKLMHTKLSKGHPGSYISETDVLEAHWATYNDVATTITGGSIRVAEQLCALTNRLMLRVTDIFVSTIRNKTTPNPAQIVSWYENLLVSVRRRYRKLHMFTRVLAQRFSNSAEYTLEGVSIDKLVHYLTETGHILVYTSIFESEGTYILASETLKNQPERIVHILTRAFHVTAADGNSISGEKSDEKQEETEPQYLLIIRPVVPWYWRGQVMVLEDGNSGAYLEKKMELEPRDYSLRLVADGPQSRLAYAKDVLNALFCDVDQDGNIYEPTEYLTCVAEQQAHLPSVNKLLVRISRASTKFVESIVDSIRHIRTTLRGVEGCQDLLENWYLFASEHGRQHAQHEMKFNRLLVELAISWLSFICDDCDPTNKTFKWAVNALEFTYSHTRRHIVEVSEEQFQMIKCKVAICMMFLTSHFDLLGARASHDAKEKMKEQVKQAAKSHKADIAELSSDFSPGADGHLAYTNQSTRMFWERIKKAMEKMDASRNVLETGNRMRGHVLDSDKAEDQSILILMASTVKSKNFAIRWQQGRYIGHGAFGQVSLAINLDSGLLMAVKEIKLQEFSGSPDLYNKVKDELSVMELLHHPNIVEYYGMEVHRDKVYIFEEYCQGGSLATLLMHGRIEDEAVIQFYTMDMLQGLIYLHSMGIVHRDIKPDNLLIDMEGRIKLADFGAAKILAKNQRTVHRTRRSEANIPNGTQKSLTGTPMYMSPEIIKNEKRGPRGAMDIWSLGCVVLECATGKKPWSNLDNEWAIMFHIGVATQHPPLPEPHQLSELGRKFIERCLTIDATLRPTAEQLMHDEWMVEWKTMLESYNEDDDMVSQSSTEIPPDKAIERATVAHYVALAKEEVDNVNP
ncbi:hypothetical protein FISHEDRAFT_37444 [Fistulina hepatica ATCC 64428]|uniref:Protein kinase domain-containing protein n=1 Tax=Fistulina hepatica ATCC 64428 TaxID=1128425 RepID=A0A0D7AJ35_9AGAR|nr:hypothetical protein FISHEDRAFT_37444 [Fistulina hepatica ATCC 64428]